MTKIKRAMDIASEATSAVGWTDAYSAMFHAEKVIKEDRLSHKEAIVEALEQKRQENVACPTEYNCPFCQRGLIRKCISASAREDINDTYNQAIAIVNSIYKDSE